MNSEIIDRLLQSYVSLNELEAELIATRTLLSTQEDTVLTLRSILNEVVAKLPVDEYNEYILRRNSLSRKMN